MKNIFNYIILLFLVPCVLVAMEQETQPSYNHGHKPNPNKTNTKLTETRISHKKFDDFIASIDDSINKEYASNPILGFIAEQRLSEADMDNIIKKKVNENCIYNGNKLVMNNKIIIPLYEKNTFFKKAIDHFTELASQNIKKVTYDSLATITDPETIQPTSQLNELPRKVKKFVMNKAQEQIQHSYDLTLVHTQNEKINCFDISVSTDLAVTGSDSSIRLWNLKRGEWCLTTLSEEAVGICFSTNGSHITAMQRGPIIKQWKINGSQLICTHRYQFNVDTLHYLSYMQYLTNNIVLAMMNNQRSKQRTTGTKYRYGHISVQFNHDKTVAISDLTVSPITYVEESNTFDQDPYYVSAESNIPAPLKITKKNCHTLYLCELAIQNHQDTLSLENIEQSQQYQQLTEYEKAIITAKIEEKRTELGKKTRQKNITTL
jgi:WD40 repeat protein